MTNTIWSPRLPSDASPIYVAIADALEKDVESGVLHDGARLPTHRQLAGKLGVTPLTITRAYKEAARRGLIDSTVGRGTFVRTAAGFESTARQEGAILDLSRNIISGSDALELDPRLLQAIRPILRSAEYESTEGTLRHRTAAAAWMKRAGVEASPDRIVITPGAQQSIVAFLASLCAPGDTILCEEWTYPRFGAIASLLRLKVETVELDEHGAIPQSIERAIRRGAPKALYLVPNFQNPTGSVMPEKRRREIAAIIHRHKLPVMEDDVYGFLLEHAPVPLVTLAPAHVVYVTSISKSVTPSLRLGFTALPETMVDAMTSAMGAITAFTSSVTAEIFTQLLESGATDRVIAAKRAIIVANRRAAERALGETCIGSHPMSPHIWMRLAKGVDAHEVADRARSRGIQVLPSPAFSPLRGALPNAVRISLGATADARALENALRTISSLAATRCLASPTVV